MTPVKKAATYIALLIAASAGSSAAISAISPDEAYLDGLQGTWVMEGAVGGKPVAKFPDMLGDPENLLHEHQPAVPGVVRGRVIGVQD